MHHWVKYCVNRCMKSKLSRKQALWRTHRCLARLCPPPMACHGGEQLYHGTLCFIYQHIYNLTSKIINENLKEVNVAVLIKLPPDYSISPWHSSSLIYFPWLVSSSISDFLKEKSHSLYCLGIHYFKCPVAISPQYLTPRFYILIHICHHIQETF